MRLTRSPVELVRARTMPMWPLWLLVILTPVLHLLWVSQLTGTLSIYSTEWEATGGASGTLVELLWPEIFASCIAIGIWAWYHYRRRDVDRSLMTGTSGWRYERVSWRVHAGRFTAFPRPRTRAGAISNVAWGPLDDDLASSYTVWTSKVHRYSVERVELPADLPAVVIVPLGWFDRLAQSLEFAPFAVELAEFNARWRVVAADARVASAVLNPPMIEYLLSRPLDWDMGITIDGAALMVWSPGRMDPQDIKRRLGVARKLATLVPSFVYPQLGDPRRDEWGPASMTAWLASDAAADAAAARAAAAAHAAAAQAAAVNGTVLPGNSIPGVPVPVDPNAQMLEELYWIRQSVPGPVRWAKVGLVVAAFGSMTAFVSLVMLWTFAAAASLVVAAVGAGMLVLAVRRIASSAGIGSGKAWLTAVAAPYYPPEV